MRTKSVWMVVLRGCVFCTWIFAMVASGLSCRGLSRQASTQGPRGQLVKDGEVPILMTRLGQYPKRLVTSADSVAVKFYFDPQLVDLTQITGYHLWSLDGATRTWRKIGAASTNAPQLHIQPTEGVHGLRASVTCADGRERLVPSSNDEPAVWLCVDRTPPAITWISPMAESPIRGLRSLDLKWSTNEVQFGDAKARLEWSSDRGDTWKPIAEVPVAYGPQGYRWRLPSEVSSNILVRISSRDMAGHDSLAALALTYPGSVTSAGPAIAMPTAVGDEDTREPKQLAEPSTPGLVQASVPNEPGKSEPNPAIAAPAATGSVVAGGATASPGKIETSTPPGVTVAPLDGSPPNETAGPLPAGPVNGSQTIEILSSPRGGRAPGSTASVVWNPIAALLGSASEILVKAETSDDSGQTWVAVGQSQLANGKVEWTLPGRTVSRGLVRLSATLPDGTRLEAVAKETFSVDADPPRVKFVDLPEVLASAGRLTVSCSDGAGSGVDRLALFLRRASSKDWQEIDVARMRVQGDAIEVDLSDQVEDSYDLWLMAFDKAGNSSRAPSAEAGPFKLSDSQDPVGRFRLDRTPPSIRVRPGPIAWVAGFPTELSVEVDWTDGVPPLVLEAEEPDGSWNELGRWASVSPDQTGFAFIVPAGISQYHVRFSVTDSAGNKAIGDVGRHAVESAVRFGAFTDGKAYAAGDSEKISWSLHPVAQEVADELTVDIAHQPSRAANWVMIHDKLAPRSDVYWDLPAGDGEEHRLRVRILRKGKVLGEDISPPFIISGGSAVMPTVVRIKEDSIFESDQAQKLAQKFFVATEAGTSGASELARLQESVIAAYEKALKVDASNYHATYGLAQFLNRTDGEKSAALVARWLEKTLEIKPDHLWALNDLGAACIREGQFQKAEEVLRKSAAIESAPIVLYNLGLALFFAGKQVDARERFEAALKESKGTLPEGEIYYYLVQSFLQEGNVERARSLFGQKQTSMPADMREEIAKAIQG